MPFCYIGLEPKKPHWICVYWMKWKHLTSCIFSNRITNSRIFRKISEWTPPKPKENDIVDFYSTSFLPLFSLPFHSSSSSFVQFSFWCFRYSVILLRVSFFSRLYLFIHTYNRRPAWQHLTFVPFFPFFFSIPSRLPIIFCLNVNTHTIHTYDITCTDTKNSSN